MLTAAAVLPRPQLYHLHDRSDYLRNDHSCWQENVKREVNKILLAGAKVLACARSVACHMIACGLIVCSHIQCLTWAY